MGTLRHPRTRRAAIVTASLALLVGAVSAGCGTDLAPMSAPVAEPGHNHADVAFAAEMIPHHEQGIHLVDLVGQHTVGVRFADLTESIASGQAAEIDEMESWLTAWAEPTSPAPDHLTGSETRMKHAMTGSMRGLMRSRMGPWALGVDDMETLAECPSARFGDRWLRMMITHHQGAISMARHEITHGEYPPAIALAEDVVTTQQAEIEQMRRLLHH